MKIGKIILVVLGAALLALGVKGLMDIPGQQAALENAVWLEQPVVLPENEGKLVVIHGVPEMLTPVHDEDFGLTLNTIKAIRYVEEYALISDMEQIETYNWVPRNTKTLTGRATLGAFELDEGVISAFPADKECEAFDPAQLSANGYHTSYGKTTEGARTSRLWVIDGGEYYYDGFEYNRSLDIPHAQREIDKAIVEERRETMAVAYRIYAPDSDAALTISGVQQGNRLVADAALGPMVRSGVVAMEQLLSANRGGIIGGAAVFMALGAALVFLGLRKAKAKAA